jgi:NAD(P) transhydrogenase
MNTERSYAYRWYSTRLDAESMARPVAVDLLGDESDHEKRETSSVRLDNSPAEFKLYLPIRAADSADHLRGLANLVSGWVGSAMNTLAESASGVALTPLALAPMLLPVTQALKALLEGPVASGLAGGLPGALPMKLCGLTSFLSAEDADLLQGSTSKTAAMDAFKQATHVGVFSLTSAVMFIASIRGLNKHSTAKEGNYMGMLATALGIVSVLASPGFNGAHLRFFSAFLTAGILGYGVATTVQMEDMPQLVAGFHSFVGLAAVLAGFASYLHPEPFLALKAIETIAGMAVGMLTFTGSVVAAGKLHGVIPGRPIILDNRWAINIGGLSASAVLTFLFSRPAIFSQPLGVVCLTLNTAIWGVLGANMVLPIGGADMPVVVSLLNAFSGLATSAAGFMLSNNLLTITGALVASSGTLLSDIMCRGINRSMANVLLGGFGTDGTSAASEAGSAPAGRVTEVSPVGFVGMLLNAKRVMIVPGYGLAVARCQQRLAEIVALLRKHGVVVHFAIHPVAGRLPGHMNVLLAEADIPYDIVKEMNEVNPDLPQYDVAIVLGANDIVNPATQTDVSSPIYGMPCITAWEAKTCVVMKRSMATGYSGVDNPLFYLSNVRMLFGDAKQSVDTIFQLLVDSQDRIRGNGGNGGYLSEGVSQQAAEEAPEEETYPEACKVVGIIRERRAGEQRVSVSPSVIPALRKMHFSVLLEAGAGTGAGFADDDYLRQGGVQVAESAEEVLQQADVVLKVNEPLLEEIQVLNSSQTVAGFWNMFGSEDLTEALGQSTISCINLALVPRVSRAQKLDALTSMANIAGYRATLDAFNHLPRFSRSSVTACGAVPPARVFVIGAGVAGLSAIATAHALGAKVFANDVRNAVRDQVESLGAEFIPIEAEGIVGEGQGGYAREMGQAFQEAQLATYARVVGDMDIVITTAMIPNRTAPQLIPESVVQSMRRGSVIVDLAAQSGGNCALTRMDETVVTPEGITIIGNTNYPTSMAAQASEMMANNFVALLETLGGGQNFGGEHWDDAIIRPSLVAHQGQLLWPPPPQPPSPELPSGGAAPPAAAAGPPAPMPPPSEVQALIDWLRAHQHELALGVGAAIVLGLGFATDIPEAELTHIGYFVLSLLIGHFTVAGVTPALHTPLISVTNAISGIIVVGGMLQLSGPLLSARVACALAAVFLSSVNIVGGFAVTHRMLAMFRDDKR